MRADLGFTRAESHWRAAHGVTTTERRTLNRRARRLLAKAFGAIPPGPHGFDVSSYQPAAPDFRAGGRTFAIFKCTEGTSYFDPHFAANRAKAHAQGLDGIGLYHFARPGSHSAAAEAAWFLSHAGAPGPNEFAVLDYEVPPWLEDWVVQFIQILAAHGWRCAFYSYAGMVGANPTAKIAQATPWLWIAAYSSSPPGSDRWSHWTLWQHTDGGVDGPWDCSVAYVPLFAQLTGGPAPAPPPAPPPPEPPTPLEDHMSLEFIPMTRRVDAKGDPVSWQAPPGEGGKVYDYVYDVVCNPDGLQHGAVACLSWIHVGPENPVGHDAKVLIWMADAGRLRNPNPIPGESPYVWWAAQVSSSWRVAFAMGAGKVSVVGEEPLDAQLERGLVPA